MKHFVTDSLMDATLDCANFSDIVKVMADAHFYYDPRFGHIGTRIDLDRENGRFDEYEEYYFDCDDGCFAIVTYSWKYNYCEEVKAYDDAGELF